MSKHENWRGSWRGIKVQNSDGRTGVITHDDEGVRHRRLTISVEDGTEDCVQLNPNGKDGGSPGWSWWCENLIGGARWLPLGDHNDVTFKASCAARRR